MRCLLYIMVIVLFAAACKPTVPDSIIQPDEMEDFLYDYYLAKAMAVQNVKSQDERDYQQHLYVEAVFERHHISHADFDSSIVYYYSHADRLESMYRRVAERLEKRALSLGAGEGEFVKYVTLGASGDTTNIWSDRTDVLLSPQPPRNRFDFEIETDTTTRSGDVFLLQFMSDYLFQTGVKDGVAVINVFYEEDTIVTRSLHYSSSGFNKLRLESPKMLTPKKIGGFFYIGGGEEKTTTLRLLFLSNIQLIRFHIDDKDDNIEAPETVAKDSLAPATDARRAAAELPGGRDSARQGEVRLPVVRRDTLH